VQHWKRPDECDPCSLMLRSHLHIHKSDQGEHSIRMLDDHQGIASSYVCDYCQYCAWPRRNGRKVDGPAIQTGFTRALRFGLASIAFVVWHGDEDDVYM
jgi:hypothetical protein